MRKLKRSDCAVLHLGLRRHWYDMIDNGIKHIEFREMKPYWNSRIANWWEKVLTGKTPVLEFQCGYGRFSPRMTFIAGAGRDHGDGRVFGRLDAAYPVQHKDLGEFPKNRYILFIGERCELVKESEAATDADAKLSCLSENSAPLSQVHAVCFDCARLLGFTPKDKAVGVWTDKCGICHRIKPCTSLVHDWNPPPKKEPRND